MKLRPLLAVLALTSPAAFAQGPQPAMERAYALTEQAYLVLKNGATADKGGHRRAAMDKLQEALREIQRGINFDNRNRNSTQEGKRP
jgi:hypothetical protein